MVFGRAHSFGYEEQQRDTNQRKKAGKGKDRRRRREGGGDDGCIDPRGSLPLDNETQE